MPRVALLRDRGGVAEAVERLVDVDPASPIVLDLRALDSSNAGAADAKSLRDVALAAFHAARDERRPQAIFFAHRGVAGAGLPGFAKALAREWPDSVAKAVGFDADAAPADVADALVAELRASDATPEVVYRRGERLVATLAPSPTAARDLPEGAVVVIAGGTRGLGAKLALELARRARARLALLGRSAPDAELVRAIAAAGGQATHHACDVTDAAQVAAAIAAARDAHGPIQLVVHAAGVLADGPVEQKSDADFTQVFDTKVAGALALATATAADPVQTCLFFSSWAGRFGNAAQTDYSSANGALAALAAHLGARAPRTRFVALALPPWEGTAMVETIPAPVRAAMRAAGVTFLDDATGLDLLVRELAAGGPSGEIVLGRDLPAVERRDVLRLAFATATHPWLDDHRVAGRPVVPLAAAASLALDAVRRVSDGPTQLGVLELDGGIVLAADGGEKPVIIRATAGKMIDVELTTPDGARLPRRRPRRPRRAPRARRPGGADAAASACDLLRAPHLPRAAAAGHRLRRRRVGDARRGHRAERARRRARRGGDAVHHRSAVPRLVLPARGVLGVRAARSAPGCRWVLPSCACLRPIPAGG